MVLRWAALVTGLGILLTTLTVGRRVMVWPFAAAAGLLTTVWGWFLVTPNFYSLEAALLSLARACLLRVRRAVVALDGGRGHRRGRHRDGEAECRRVYGSRPLHHDLGIAVVRRSTRLARPHEDERPVHRRCRRCRSWRRCRGSPHPAPDRICMRAGCITRSSNTPSDSRCRSRISFRSRRAIRSTSGRSW